MCEFLHTLTGKNYKYSYASANPSDKNAHTFKCYSRDGLTHFVEVNYKDDVLYDTVYDSKCRANPDSCSYRCYYEF